MSNIHGTLILLGDRGVLITGPSGAGKSTLAFELIRQASSFSRLVSDDRVIIERRPDGRMMGHVPPAIAGQIEIHGLGIVTADFEGRAVIDLIVELADPATIERMPQAEERDGVALVRIPWRQSATARQHVAVALCLSK